MFSTCILSQDVGPERQAGQWPCQHRCPEARGGCFLWRGGDTSYNNYSSWPLSSLSAEKGCSLAWFKQRATQTGDEGEDSLYFSCPSLHYVSCLPAVCLVKSFVRGCSPRLLSRGKFLFLNNVNKSICNLKEDANRPVKLVTDELWVHRQVPILTPSSNSNKIHQNVFVTWVKYKV